MGPQEGSGEQLARPQGTTHGVVRNTCGFACYFSDVTIFQPGYFRNSENEAVLGRGDAEDPLEEGVEHVAGSPELRPC